MIIGSILALLIGAAGGTIVGSSLKEGDRSKITKEYIDNYQAELKKRGMEDISTKELLGRLNQAGKISNEDLKIHTTTIEDIEKQAAKGGNMFGVNWLGTRNKGHEDARRLYTTLAENIPAINEAAYVASDFLSGDASTLFKRELPKITGVPAPKYYNTNFSGEQLEVDPVKLWSGKDLADLHDIDYDTESLYDLVKGRTGAQVDLAQYKSGALGNAQELDQTKQRSSYLDTMRNIRAESITKGVTQGSRAAAELLGMSENFRARAENQPKVADERFKMVDAQIKADAQAKLTARNTFDKLAQAMSTDSLSLYASDTARFGQDHRTNADLYTADEGLRGMYSYVNGQMAGSQAEANAAVNLARAQVASGANDPRDQYAWMFNAFLKGNDGNVQGAYSNMNDYLNRVYTSKNRYDYATTLPKQ